ncbi:MAG: phage tail fiber protein, partial [Alphaproteobacteria bacterium]
FMTDHVKIYGVKPRIQYTADGSLTDYEFPFAIFKTSDIDVYLGDSKQEPTTYTVSEIRHSDGGAVRFETAPEPGTIITIVRNLSIERTSDFQEGSTLRAKVLNDELDYQIACTQQIAENLNRSMVLPPYAEGSDLDLTLPTPSAGKAIVWNADGTNLENSTVEVNALESTLKGYKETAESAASSASAKAEIASDKAELATTKAQLASDKADIASQKATEVSNALSTKANINMDNLSATGKSILVNFPMPDYSSAISLGVTTYTAPSTGWLYCNFEGNGFVVQLEIDSQECATGGGINSNNDKFMVPIKIGQTAVINVADRIESFIPCIGG